MSEESDREQEQVAAEQERGQTRYGYNEHDDSWETCEGAFFPCEKHRKHRTYSKPLQDESVGFFPSERHLK
jgi:hypothetical protein